jgi:hypothetical protein
MKKMYAFAIISIVLLLSTIYEVSAAEPYAKIYPKEGTIFTDIYIQIRNLGDGILFHLYAWWDDKLIIERLQNPDYAQYIWQHDYKGLYDTHISAPNEYPYTELRNHTVFIEIWKERTTFFLNFTLTFKIVEYYPPPSFYQEWWDNLPQEFKDQLKGEQGIQGERGATGLKGDEGDVGQQGIQGERGVQGEKGYKGETGAAGPQGQQGIQGLKGETGLSYWREAMLSIVISSAAITTSLVVYVGTCKKESKEKVKSR